MRDFATQDVLRERCAYAYRRLLAAAGGSLMLGLVLGLLLWSSRQPLQLVLWEALTLGSAAMLAGLYWMWQRTGADGVAVQSWVRRLAIAAAALGAGWGYGAAVFFPGEQEGQVAVGFAVAMVAAGGLPLFSTLWWVYAVFAAAVMLPFGVVLVAFGSPLQRALGASVPLLYALNLFAAYELGRAFTSAYGLRAAGRRLAEGNAEIQEQLREQLDSLLDAHRQLQSASRKLTLFTERAPIAVFEVDANATILDVNPAAENLLGYAGPELVGRACTDMLFGEDPDARWRAWWREFIAAGVPATVTAEHCLRRDGLELACEWTLTPLPDEQGGVRGVIVQGRDITQQRAAERVRSEFTSTLSHELRTPLTSILGSLQLLRSGALGDVDKEQEELLAMAERNGLRLLDLINEVLDIEKIESGRLSLVPEAVDLGELVAESIRLNQGYADRFQVRFALHAQPGLVVRVRGDRKRLMQVMTNMLSNAVKFSPLEGTVEVVVGLAEGVARVSVSDRGPGIPQAFRSRIFGRFAQADPADSRIRGGTGLGLAICKRLMEMMAGRIGFEDRPGGGTTFYIEMAQLAEGRDAEESLARVLITEPDGVLADYLAMALEKEGYHADVAHDLETTRALFGRWNYVAWLLARRLPDDGDPLALVGEVGGRVPVIMLAGLATDESSVPDPERLGIRGWLSKSDSRARILEVVNGAVGRSARA